MALTEQIKKIKESSKKRNFNQRYDLIVTLKDINLKKAESKIDEILVLPKQTGKPTSISLFSDSVKKIENCEIIKGEQIEKLSKNKKELKKLIYQTTIFLSEPKLMPVVGKHLGKFLAPIGKMPKPVVGDIIKMANDYRNGVKIEIKKQPMIQITVGSENIKEEDVTENITAVLNFLKTKLPKGKNNINKVYLKLTMGHPIKMEGW